MGLLLLFPLLWGLLSAVPGLGSEQQYKVEKT